MNYDFIDPKIVLNNISKNFPFIIQQWLKFDTINDDFIVDSNAIFAILFLLKDGNKLNYFGIPYTQLFGGIQHWRLRNLSI